MSNLSTCANIFRVVFCIINGLFLLIGCAILATGIYLQTEARNYSFITGSDYVSGPALLITSGVITIIISAVGFVGACLKWRPLLIIYAIVLALIIILEIVTGAVGFVFSDSTAEESEDEFRDRLRKAIEQFDTNEDAESAMNYLQDSLSCCGIDNATDWRFGGNYLSGNNGTLPETCMCDPDKEGDDDCAVAPSFVYNYTASNGMLMMATYDSQNPVWTAGCYNSTVDFLIASAIIWGGVGIAFGIFEIIGIIVALGLVCCITCAKRKEKQYV